MRHKANPLNRTLLELKLVLLKEDTELRLALNRTLLELKLAIRSCLPARGYDSQSNLIGIETAEGCRPGCHC